jgi:hypothetical protein
MAQVQLEVLRNLGPSANSQQIDCLWPVDLNNLTRTDRAPHHEEAQ